MFLSPYKNPPSPIEILMQDNDGGFPNTNGKENIDEHPATSQAEAAANVAKETNYEFNGQYDKKVTAIPSWVAQVLPTFTHSVNDDMIMRNSFAQLEEDNRDIHCLNVSPRGVGDCSLEDLLNLQRQNDNSWIKRKI